MNTEREIIMSVSEPYWEENLQRLPDHIQHFVDAEGRNHTMLRIEIQVTGFRRAKEDDHANQTHES